MLFKFGNHRLFMRRLFELRKDNECKTASNATFFPPVKTASKRDSVPTHLIVPNTIIAHARASIEQDLIPVRPLQQPAVYVSPTQFLQRPKTRRTKFLEPLRAADMSGEDNNSGGSTDLELSTSNSSCSIRWAERVAKPRKSFSEKLVLIDIEDDAEQGLNPATSYTRRF